VLILNVSKKLCFFRTTFTAPSCWDIRCK
jgi:hypothetical protein